MLKQLLLISAFTLSHPAHAGNSTIESFSRAKKLLPQVYQGMEKTFYCNCQYQGKALLTESCSYRPRKTASKRARRIEWEHIVPASDFGRSFKVWREGHSSCVAKNGKKFRGRNCARKVSVEFRRMEADLYNLVPSIGEINNIRGNKPAGKVLSRIKDNTLPGCSTRISKEFVEPANEIKGFVARVYKYMHHAYPGHGIISRKNQKLFDAWDRQYPPGREEKKRAEKIFKLQGNKNHFVLKDLQKHQDKVQPKIPKNSDRKSLAN